jgi:hypothetical protein
MSGDVTVEFEKSDGTSGQISFENVDELNEVAQNDDTSNSKLIAYRDGGTNGTVDNVVDYSENWE